MEKQITSKKLYLLFVALFFIALKNVNAQHDFDRYKDSVGWYDFRNAEIDLLIDSVFIL